MPNIKDSTLLIVLSGTLSISALAQNSSKSKEAIEKEVFEAELNTILIDADNVSENPLVSPIRRIVRNRPAQAEQKSQGNNRPGRPGGPPPPQENDAYRTYDGSNNNLTDVLMGSTEQHLLRLVTADYSDGISALAGASRASARAISNAISAQTDSIPNDQNASDFVWQWGQFVDHDFTLSDGADPAEPANIDVPIGDPYFDPASTGTKSISLNRTIYDSQTGTSTENPRQQINEITSWIDASNVYGSNDERAQALRTNDGTGRLKTSEGNFLPFNDEGFPNAGGSSAELFFAGDVRSNEQVGLSVMHTLFMREHNWQAQRIRNNNRSMSGEEIYQRARQIVGAEMQAITYYEYLPALLGRDAISRYRGYDDGINASIANEFSNAIFRYGHSALSATLKRLDAEGETIAEGDVSLRNGFFSPHRITEEGGIDPFLRGLASQVSQKVDNYIIDDVRNFLFGPPGSGGFDLAALNIQRGRDHGLPSYNAVREAYGLAAATNFSDISSDPQKQAALASVYSDVNDIDLWVGGLSEDATNDSMVGELISIVIIEQFEALRDGDRFWYENIMDSQQQREIRATKLSDVIRRNTNIGNEISSDVFHVREVQNN
jgi:hypothetical protein